MKRTGSKKERVGSERKEERERGSDHLKKEKRFFFFLGLKGFLDTSGELDASPEDDSEADPEAEADDDDEEEEEEGEEEGGEGERSSLMAVTDLRAPRACAFGAGDEARRDEAEADGDGDEEDREDGPEDDPEEGGRGRGVKGIPGGAADEDGPKTGP